MWGKRRKPSVKVKKDNLNAYKEIFRILKKRIMEEASEASRLLLRKRTYYLWGGRSISPRKVGEEEKKYKRI